REEVILRQAFRRVQGRQESRKERRETRTEAAEQRNAAAITDQPSALIGGETGRRSPMSRFRFVACVSMTFFALALMAGAQNISPSENTATTPDALRRVPPPSPDMSPLDLEKR